MAAASWEPMALISTRSLFSTACLYHKGDLTIPWTHLTPYVLSEGRKSGAAGCWVLAP